jgi:hypothetical protein
MFRHDPGDSFRLIIATVELACGVERDRYEHRPCEVPAEDFVRKGRVRKVVGQEWAPLIFDTMDDSTSGPAGAKGTDRPGEGRLEVEAMGAGSVAFEDAFEGVTAGQATRVVDAGELLGPGGGQVEASPVVHWFLRDRAVPGED